MDIKLKKVKQLIEQVEGLCAAHIGKKAEGETWGETYARLENLSKAVKAARKEIEQQPSSKDQP